MEASRGPMSGVDGVRAGSGAPSVGPGAPGAGAGAGAAGAGAGAGTDALGCLAPLVASFAATEGVCVCVTIRGPTQGTTR